MGQGKFDETISKLMDSLTDEQKAKARACKTWEELVQLAGQEGIELPGEVLDMVAGGYSVPKHSCGL